MKKVFKFKDDYGGYVEVSVLNHNNQVSEDLIWLHLCKSDKEEMGFCMTTAEAVIISEGLLKAVNKIGTYEFPEIK